MTATATFIAPGQAVLNAPKPEKKVSTAGVLAVVSGVMNLALLVVMFVLVRRFYRMYRAERVLRKQTQTEGVELKEGGAGRGDAREDEWGLRHKEQWGLS